MYIYWILLGLAIATEITGTLSMKWASVSEGNGRASVREMAALF